MGLLPGSVCCHAHSRGGATSNTAAGQLQPPSPVQLILHPRCPPRCPRTPAGELKEFLERLGWKPCIMVDDSPLAQTTEPFFADEAMDIWKAKAGGVHV